MKTLAAIAAIMFVITPATAQAADGTSSNRSPTFQNGSNNRAGGPANELNSPTGGVPIRDRSGAEQQGIPAYQLGSNNRAGGPANELNSPTGR